MSKTNVPDDWDCYWTSCSECGHRWHLSERNSCEKCEQQKRWYRESYCGYCDAELLAEEDLLEGVCVGNDEYYFCNTDCLDGFLEELEWKEKNESQKRRDKHTEELRNS